MGSGGNAGGQTSVTIIRGLAIDEIRVNDIFRIILKELRVAFLCGTTLGVATFIKILFIDYKLLNIFTPYHPNNVDFFYFDPEVLKIACVVGLTIMLTIIAAKLIGCLLPILAKKVRLDPAVMASPLITTVVDVLSLLIYIGIATMFLLI